MTTVLITGIGGTRSIAVLKALRMSGQQYRIIGSDANYFNAGSFQCAAAYTVPFASDPAYLPRLEEIIEAEKVQIIFATVEKEVKYLATQKVYLESKYDVSVVVPERQTLDVMCDKYATQEFLADAGFTHIPSVYHTDRKTAQDFASAQGFPLIRKPVFGYGSKGLSMLDTQEELDALEPDKNFVLQKRIQNAESETFYNTELNEYTAEVFVNADGSVAGGIIIKRALHGGETVAGYLVKDQPALDYLCKVALATGIKGPINFQFRSNEDGIFIFEINPLFSGTTAVRAKLGFNSVQLAVDSFVHGKHGTVSQDALTPQYFLRYLEEIFIDPAQLETLRSKRHIGDEL